MEKQPALLLNHRQSLDGIIREGPFERIEKVCDAFGWDVVRIKQGALQRAAFPEPGEDALRASPGVTGATALGTFVNHKGLFARQELPDAFTKHRIPSTAKWNFGPEGQHIELGIAEVNPFPLLGAAGLSHSLLGKRLIPIGTVYGPFMHRGLDALNYACYQDTRLMIVGTPSEITLAPEGGVHQSIGTPLTVRAYASGQVGPCRPYGAMRSRIRAITTCASAPAKYSAAKAAIRPRSPPCTCTASNAGIPSIFPRLPAWAITPLASA